MSHILATTHRFVENSTQRISKFVYEEFEASPRFMALVEAGVLGLVRTKNVPFGIRTTEQVGHVLLESGVRLTIEEKIPGALASLLHWSLPADLRPVSVPSSVSRETDLIDVFIARFTSSLGLYLGRGRVKSYIDVKEDSFNLRGRLDVTRTIRLRARGRLGLLAVRRRALSADLPVNRLLAVGLYAAEAYVRGTSDLRRLTQLRALAPLFEDVHPIALARLNLDLKRAAFESALQDERTEGVLRDALAYARALVLHLGPLADEEDGSVPVSFFLNLQDLFEDAIRNVWTELMPGRQIAAGRSVREWVLGDNDHGLYKAHPDVFVKELGSVLAVSDVKYKDLGARELPSNSDVYQLLAHCSAFRSHKGVLVFPGRLQQTRAIGTSPHGTTLWLSLVRPSHLKEDLRMTFEACSL